MKTKSTQMFKWLGRRNETKKQEPEKQGTKKQKSKQAVSSVNGLVRQPEASSSASVRSILKTAVADAEQIVASIKMKAQTEAEEEAARIIAQANKEAEEIKRGAETVAEKGAEDILSVASKNTEDTEVEARQKALLFFLRAREGIEEEIKGEYKNAYSRLLSLLQDVMREGQNIEEELKGKRARLQESKGFQLREQEAALPGISGEAAPSFEASAPMETEAKPDVTAEEKVEEPVQPRDEAVEEKAEEPVQPRDEAAVSEPVAAATEELLEQHLPEERPDSEETESDLLKQSSQTLYTGEVELAIAAPVNPNMVSKLYSYLQTTPEIKFVRTNGSWNRGTTITVVLDKPIPLVSVISSKIPEAEVTPERPERDGFVSGKRGVRRIKLALKEM